MLKKRVKIVIESIRERPVNGILILLIVALYFLNNLVFKGHSKGWLHVFFSSYFNDLMAPVFLLAFSNTLLLTIRKQINHIQHILIFCLISGCVWEFFAPLVKKTAVTDLIDLLCYMSGGIIYWVIYQMQGYSK